VEGFADLKTYGKLLGSEIAVMVNCHTFEGVISIAAALCSTQTEGIVGIVDADFHQFDPHFELPLNVFTTDSHDLESMILSSPVVDDLIYEFADHEKYQSWSTCLTSSFIQHLVVQAAEIGYLLWYSLSQKLNLNFDELRPAEFIDPSTLTINTELLIQHVKQRSQKQHLPGAVLAAGILEKKKICDEPWFIARGKDVIDIFGFAVRKTIGGCDHTKSSRESIESHLRVGYKREYFLNTGLFRALKDWCNKHPGFGTF
jgi:hypothetical protein